MSTIPASTIVNISTNVLSTGGAQLSMNGVILSQSTALTTVALQQFATESEVLAFFGAGIESDMASKYFSGYTIAQSKPGLLYFYKYSLGEGTVAQFMDGLVNLTKNWATFSTTFEPTLAAKKSLADWTSAQDHSYIYMAWDTDSTNNVVDTLTDNFNNYLQINKTDFVSIVSRDTALTSVNLYEHAAFMMGIAASIDFNQTNNRPTFAFKSQANLTPTVTTATLKSIFETNGINFYGSFATANNQFVFLYNGSISGSFQWLDAAVNAIYMKNRMQSTLMTLLVSVPSIPYNQQGYQGLIATSLLGDIASFVNYGAIRVGVQPTAEQSAIVQFQAGVDVSQALFNQGYYLQVKDPGGAARQARTSPTINFWYMDGGAVQKINMTATLIQ